MAKSIDRFPYKYLYPLRWQGVRRYWKYKLLLRRSINALNPDFIGKAVKLNLGCGANIMDGWLNADLVDSKSVPPGMWPIIGKIFIMDASEKFPFRDNQFDLIYCEDFIEHFDQKDGLSIFAECFRTLKPGGIWRIATPDFNQVIHFFEMNHRDAIDFKHWGWGHKLLYAEQYARMVLGRCGFSPVVRCEFGESEHVDLKNIDTRKEQKDWSLILEAEKPS